MEKSEVYYMAQVAVLTSPTITPENKLAILRVLIADENLALFTERQKEMAAEEE